MTSTQPDPRSGFPWRGVALGCGLLLVLGVGSCVAAGYYLSRVLREVTGFTLDSTAVEAKAQTIFKHQLPGGAEGMVSFHLGPIEFAGVTNRDGSTILMLGRVDAEVLNENDRQELEASFREQVREWVSESRAGKQVITVERNESRRLCDQSASLLILEGEEQEGSTTVPSVVYQSAVLHQEDLLLFLLISTGNNALLQAEQVFASLDCP
ncbi:hypothetical protein [Thermostichus vulcanus]|uniref:Uncharacterized protein n=1 Tax=Thermostichus vulcanus str. 'Rupite' TaxID=2813851 RepID=A0ABT0CD12_THEVL|nr:hypothetical protein [Thermostichus vulcanus]MCJ2543220.1 hypothetical protein [Thermostichus vulcanus str. 'Rupite']